MRSKKFILSCLMPLSLFALTDTEWVPGATSLWNGSSNWSAGIPKGGAFNAVIGQVGSPAAIDLNVNADITSITFSTTTSYTISPSLGAQFILSQDGSNSPGIFNSAAATNTINPDITFIGNAIIQVNAGTLNLNGALKGGDSSEQLVIDQNSGGGTVNIGGSSPNTYAGTVVVRNNTGGAPLTLQKSNDVVAIAGDLVLGPSTTVLIAQSNAFSSSTNITMEANAFLQDNSSFESQTLNSITIKNQTIAGAKFDTNQATYSFGSTATAIHIQDCSLNTTVIGGNGFFQLTGATGGDIVCSDSSNDGSFNIIDVLSVDLGSPTTGTRIVNVDTVNPSKILRFPSATIFTGNSGMTKRGNGTLQFIAVGFNFTGPLTIEEGTVLFTSGIVSGAPHVVIDGGTMDTGNATVALGSLTFNSGTTTGSSAITLSSGATALSMRGGTTLTVPTTVSTSGATIAFDRTGNGTATIANTLNLNGLPKIFNIASGDAQVDMNITSTLSNGSFTKTGYGILQLAGTTTVSSIDINQGAFQVTSTLPSIPVTINSGGVLSGTGTIGAGGATVTNSGTVHPGVKPKYILTGIEGAPHTAVTAGTLPISGTYTQTNSGTLAIDVVSPTATDLLTVSGAASLAGSLDVTLLSPQSILTGDRVTVLTAGSVTGTFSHLVPHSPHNNFGFFATYNPTSVDLTLIVNSLTNYASFGSTTLAQVNAANIQIGHHADYLRDRFSSKRSGSKISSLELPLPGLTAALGTPKKPIKEGYFRKKAPGKRASVYVAPLGSIGHINSHSRQRFSSVGGLVGADYAFSQVGFGLQGAYQHTSGHIGHHQGHYHIDSGIGKFYLTTTPFSNVNSLFFDFAAGGSSNWYKLRRPTTTGTAHGSPKGWEWDTFLNIGYDIRRDYWRLTPLAGVQYLNQHIEKYREHGAGVNNVTVRKQSFNSLRSNLGLRWLGLIGQGKVIFQPEVHGYYQHEFHKDHQNLTVVNTVFTDFSSTVRVVGSGKNLAILGGEARVFFNGWISAAFDYDLQVNSQQTVNSFYGELEFSF